MMEPTNEVVSRDHEFYLDDEKPANMGRVAGFAAGLATREYLLDPTSQQDNQAEEVAENSDPDSTEALNDKARLYERYIPYSEEPSGPIACEFLGDYEIAINGQTNKYSVGKSGKGRPGVRLAVFNALVDMLARQGSEAVTALEVADYAELGSVNAVTQSFNGLAVKFRHFPFLRQKTDKGFIFVRNPDVFFAGFKQEAAAPASEDISDQAAYNPKLLEAHPLRLGKYYEKPQKVTIWGLVYNPEDDNYYVDDKLLALTEPAKRLIDVLATAFPTDVVPEYQLRMAYKKLYGHELSQADLADACDEILRLFDVHPTSPTFSKLYYRDYSNKRFHHKIYRLVGSQIRVNPNACEDMTS